MSFQLKKCHFVGFYAFSQNYTKCEEYFIEYTKKISATQDRLTLMNKKGYLSKLGTEQIQGLKSGTLTYKTKISVLKGIVTLTYENFCDEDGWIFNGTITTKANMSANGTLSGTIEVFDSGFVTYDFVILKDGNPGGGTYGVKLNDGKEQQVDYSLYFVARPKENIVK